jgi:hypothetical protein
MSTETLSVSSGSGGGAKGGRPLSVLHKDPSDCADSSGRDKGGRPVSPSDEDSRIATNPLFRYI